MFQLQFISQEPNTDVEVIEDFYSENDAWDAAKEWLLERYQSNPFGRRSLNNMGGVIPDEVLHQSFNVVSYIGVWTPCKKGEVVPHDEQLQTAENDWILFTDKKGNRYLGEYDFDECVFRSSSSDIEMEADRVVAYYILPEND